MKQTTMDGNNAASYVSYALSEIAVVYPITPSSPMAELADEWAVSEKKNLFGTVPKVVQMQSEAGVAGAVHGALCGGALTTTYTCSQGLLLMLPDMYKIAGELLPAVFHVSARSLSTHALNIFGDHQDVMACRQTGFALLASSSVQEVMDLALVAHLATLKSSVPFLHFFDGFRTSHEYAKIEVIEEEEMRSLVDEKDIQNFKKRALTPDAPKQKGTAQNGDIFFQNREACNKYYLALPRIVQETMDKVAKITKRQYRLFEYFGASDAEHTVVMMGSGVGAMEETVEKLNGAGKKTGLIKVRLYRPFDKKAFLAAIPPTCKRLTVLDRSKEPSGLGEPLYLDVCSALFEEGRKIKVLGGRYGLGGKDFTPTMCLAIFKNMESATPKNKFTVGICDDVTFTSLDISEPLDAAPKDCIACKFYGLGSDGTVGANKNSIKIIGDNTSLYVQGYFYYDSKKSGGVTVSHLRFGSSPIHSSYLIDSAHFIACHDPSYLTRYDMLSSIRENGKFLLNCPWSDGELEEKLPPSVKRILAERNVTFYAIDGTQIAKENGLQGRTSTVMQAAFFLINPHILPYDKAKALLKQEIGKNYAKKGEKILKSNYDAIDAVEARIRKITIPDGWKKAPVRDESSGESYYDKFISPILKLEGDSLPVSAFSPDGSVPTATSKYEKIGTAHTLPKWVKENCIQCGRCSFVCPHACIRPYLTKEKHDGFDTIPFSQDKTVGFRIQVSPHDCRGCGLCAHACPTKEKALVMELSEKILPVEESNWEYAQRIPAPSIPLKNTVKDVQFKKPLFEFSYACAGCGETPYIKILTQLFGEKMLIANATGCSSIYGGSAPVCPYAVNEAGKGPAWANSLFEDNAEFGLGLRLASDENKSVWIVGGDGWAYDIGYGGLDHVLASGANVNVLVLDSEVYSNTGGQQSKATPLGAVARFASGGKRLKKKDLGLMAMTYGYVYVAQVAMGANMQQLLTALTEAEGYNGPSLIIAYSTCIAHGFDMSETVEEEKRAVESGYWQLYRFDPSKEKPFTLDSKAPTLPLRDFLLGENRFARLKRSRPEEAERLYAQAEKECIKRAEFYKKLSEIL